MKVSIRIGVSAAIVLASALPGFSAAIRNPTGSGTNILAANDDESTGSVGLGFAVNFFGANSSTVFVSNNGNVTFTNPLPQYTPNGLSSGVGQPIIAAYFADVDTRGAASGLATYGSGIVNDASLGWINAADFAIEYPAVGYFASETNKLNTFELLLVDRSSTGAGNFDIEFNYNTVQWETGAASGGTNGLGGVPAAVGYSNGVSGSGNVFFQLPGSLTSLALLDGGPNALISNSLNSNVPGRYDFQVRNGVVVNPTPEPGSLFLLGAGAIGLGLLRRKKKS